MDVYDEMADLYDLIYCGDFDIDFYESEAKRIKGPVLEIGCGTGRVLLELLKKGIKIDGIDISGEMLRILKNKAKLMGLSPNVYQADMRDFLLKKKYALVIIPYRSFLHLSNDNDRVATLRKIRGHLNPGGKVIIHVYNPGENEAETTSDFKPIDIDRFKIGNDEITAMWYMRYSKSKNEAEYLIELHKRNRKIKEFKMRIYFVEYEKMKKLLGKAGFRNIAAYSDFAKKLFTPSRGGREILWVAEK